MRFGLSTLASWTAVICFALWWFQEPLNQLAGDSTDSDLTTISDHLQLAFMTGIVMCPALTCIPRLIDMLCSRKVPTKPGVYSLWLMLCWCIYSVAALFLATLTLGIAEWKGERGWHWSFYLNDMPMAFFTIPLYIISAIVIAQSLFAPSTRYRFAKARILFASIYNFIISTKYAIATAYFGFGQSEFSLVPGSVAVCYGLYACVLFKHREYTLYRFWQRPQELLTWLFIALSLELTKIPFAKDYYNKLPNEPPEDCFIVTAASKGHPRLVGAFYNDAAGKTVNQQLNDFWQFESSLKDRLPSLHTRLRKFYNRFGPFLAALICFRWQADLVYLLLIPLQWLCRWLTHKLNK